MSGIDLAGKPSSLAGLGQPGLGSPSPGARALLRSLLCWLFLPRCSLAWFFPHGWRCRDAGRDGGIQLAPHSLHQAVLFFPTLSFGSLCPRLAPLRWAEGKHLFIRVVSLNKAIRGRAGQAVLGRLCWPSHDRCCAFRVIYTSLDAGSSPRLWFSKSQWLCCCSLTPASPGSCFFMCITELAKF